MQEKIRCLATLVDLDNVDIGVKHTFYASIDTGGTWTNYVLLILTNSIISFCALLMCLICVDTSCDETRYKYVVLSEFIYCK